MSSLVTSPLRLDLGSGRYPAAGFQSIDAHHPADHRGDLLQMTFRDVAEVRMSHLLEHFPWRETVDVLAHIRSWMAPGGRLTVEVPDMAQIMREADENPDWLRYVYGSQENEGEYHRTGFTELDLWDVLIRSGWRVDRIESFRSDFRTRVGMPCLEAKAVAP